MSRVTFTRVILSDTKCHSLTVNSYTRRGLLLSNLSGSVHSPTLSFNKRHARAVPLRFLFTMIGCPVVFNSLISVVVFILASSWILGHVLTLEAKLL